MTSKAAWALLGCKNQAEQLMKYCSDISMPPAIVVIPPDCPPEDRSSMIELCRRESVDFRVLHKKKELLSLDLPNVILTCRFFVLPREVLEDRACYNIHSSLLPRWAGIHPVEWAIVSGDSHAGVTIHELTEEIDDGKVVNRFECRILDNDTANSLRARLDKASIFLAAELLNKVTSGQSVTVLPKLCIEKSWARRRKPTDSEINFRMPGKKVHNTIRAMSGTGHPAYFVYNDQKVELTSSTVISTDSSHETFSRFAGERLIEIQFPNVRIHVEVKSDFFDLQFLEDEIAS